MRAILAKWTPAISVHLERRWTLPSKWQSPQRQTGHGHASAAAAQHRGEAADCRRDVDRRCVSSAFGSGAWDQRQPGVWLAPALLGGETWGAQAGDEAAAGTGEREFARASAGGA